MIQLAASSGASDIVPFLRVRSHCFTASGWTALAGLGSANSPASIPNSSRSSSICSRMAASSSLVGSLCVGLRFGIFPNLTPARKGEADDAASRFPHCVDNGVEAVPDITGGHEPDFALPVAAAGGRGVPFKIVHGVEVAPGECFNSLDFVPLVFHPLIVTTTTPAVEWSASKQTGREEVS